MFKLYTFGNLYVENTHALDKKSYKGFKNLLLVAYLGLEGKQSVEHLTQFIFGDSKNPQTSFYQSWSNLKKGLELDLMPIEKRHLSKGNKTSPPYFLKESFSGKDEQRYIELDPSYLTGSSEENKNEQPSNTLPSLYLDSLALQQACASDDLEMIESIYKGNFVANFSKAIKQRRKRNDLPQANKVQHEQHNHVVDSEDMIVSPPYIQWIMDRRESFAKSVLGVTLKHLKFSGGEHSHRARKLLMFLLDNHELAFFSLGVLAEVYTHIPTPRQGAYLKNMLVELKEQSGVEYLHVLYALSLQQSPSLALACKAVGITDFKTYTQLELTYIVDDWIDESNPNLLVNGRQFLATALSRSGQKEIKYALLHALFTLTTDSSHAELFHLAWTYQLATGDFGNLEWSRLCRALRFKIQEHCRQGKFAQVQEICLAWKRETSKRKEVMSEDLHFYHTYSLERQGHHYEAWQMLEDYNDSTSFRHQALKASLRERMGTLCSEDDPYQFLDQIYNRTELTVIDAWARAEILSIKGRLAYKQMNYLKSAEYSTQAASAWQYCQETYRELGAHGNIAAAYDNAQNSQAALSEYKYIHRKLEQHPEFTTTPLALRLQLNHLILLQQHTISGESSVELAQRYQKIIGIIKGNTDIDLPELLGKALYNLAHATQEMLNFERAIELYHEALPPLARVKDVRSFGCSHGQIGICYYELLKTSLVTKRPTSSGTKDTDDVLTRQTGLRNNGVSFLKSAIDILERTKDAHSQVYHDALKRLEELGTIC